MNESQRFHIEFLKSDAESARERVRRLVFLSGEITAQKELFLLQARTEETLAQMYENLAKFAELEWSRK